MELTHRFETKEGFIRALEYIRSWGPRIRGSNYVVDFDLQELFEPLKEVMVKVDYTFRRIIFQGDDMAVKALHYDCTRLLETS